jgi:ABC-type transport system substrate-binding protein
MKRFILLLLVVAAALVVVPALLAQEDNVDVYGRPLPEDAAPYEMQVWQELCDSTLPQITFSAVESVYQRICNAGDKFSDSLVNLDENLNLIPVAAESWEVSSDGLTWTFHLRPDQVWSDGTPVTANDWVASFRYMVDPDHAYDFVWMWNGKIAGWDEAAAGDIPPEDIGMVAVDDLTLAVTTQTPIGFLPSTLFFWPPLQAAALEATGSADYQLDPATSVSSGPFILKEFVAGERVVIEANPTYNGPRQPMLREVRGIFGDALNGSFLAFQNYDIDTVGYERLAPADFEIINADPVLRDNYLPNMGDFRTDYLLFDTYNPPFDDLNVRLAFAKALDREAIVANVIGSQFAYPAYSFLAPGFPASDTSGALKDIQAYDCPAAQALLAEAGFEGGAGFPAVELKLRGEGDAVAARFIASAASISDCLGVTITVNNMVGSAYMESLLARPTTLQFGAVSYGMDYLDADNMLTLWQSTGRHSWRNAEFDSLVDQARSETDPELRTQMYQDAERILVSDVGGIFLDHRVQGNLYQPYVAGDCFRPDAQGISAWHWGNDWCWGAVYITNEVADFDTYRTRSS